MRAKSAEFFKEARVLADAKKYNGAASRLYYSLYHAVIAEFEAKGIKQANLTRKVDPNKASYWLHEVVRDFAHLAGLGFREAGLIRHAWELRTRADYETEKVKADEILGVIARAKEILESLGVDCGR